MNSSFNEECNFELRIEKINTIEIEVNTHCNWKCRYCPEKYWPKKAETMDLKLFNQIIDKVVKFNFIEYITLNAYNEPLLDVYFCERINKIASFSNIKLILYTNASLLSFDKIDFLHSSGIVDVIRINIPSVYEKDFVRLTGSILYDQTIDNIEYAISKGLPIELLVNGTANDIKKNFGSIFLKYNKFINVRVVRFETTDRAGILANEFAQNYAHKGRLCGCHQILTKLCVNVNGDFYICCMDYFQRYIYGNINDGELIDILSTQRAKRLFEQVSGEVPIPTDFICLKCFAAGFSRFLDKMKKVKE